MHRLNQNLAFELGGSLEELSALRRTIVDYSRSLGSQSSKAGDAGTESDVGVPSFMRVMAAEQSLLDNFVYESSGALRCLSSNLKTVLPLTGQVDPTLAFDDDTIPQESSIAANVSF